MKKTKVTKPTNLPLIDEPLGKDLYEFILRANIKDEDVTHEEVSEGVRIMLAICEKHVSIPVPDAIIKIEMLKLMKGFKAFLKITDRETFIDTLAIASEETPREELYGLYDTDNHMSNVIDLANAMASMFYSIMDYLHVNLASHFDVNKLEGIL